ncbi:MAG: hypothetical protein ABJM43_04685 [Paracoccaceae bacterium]
MSDSALSEAALLASLRDIRLPAEAAGGFLAEIAVAVGMAGLCAIGLVLLLRLISRRQGPVDPPTLQDHIDALAQCTDAERRVGLLHLLLIHAPNRFAELKPGLYRPNSSLDSQQLETEVARFV